LPKRYWTHSSYSKLTAPISNAEAAFQANLTRGPAGEAISLVTVSEEDLEC
jgi:hypothetical protein